MFFSAVYFKSGTGYFYFVLVGEGEGGVRHARREGGGSFFFLESPRTGWCSVVFGVPGGGEAEGLGGCLRRIGEFFGGGGGGLNIFLRGRNVCQVNFIFDGGGGASAKEKRAFTKAASVPARRQSENAGPRFF